MAVPAGRGAWAGTQPGPRHSGATLQAVSNENPAESLPVAAIQLQSSGLVNDNLSQVRRLCEAAAKAGARVMLLPENFGFFGKESDKRRLAETLGDAGPIQDTLSTLARRHRVTIVGGGMPERSDDSARPFNTSLVYGPDGALLATYRKTHLFDVELPDGTVVSESAATTPGHAATTLEVDGFVWGLSICYDLRFGALFECLSRSGADVFAVTAAFTEQTGKDHWHVLLRARAIEHQCYVVAAGQWGDHEARPRSYGHSLICDPWGCVVAECGEGPGFCLAQLDAEVLGRVRARLPCLQHRRSFE